MRFVITGGAGFIGSFVVDELLARGHEVVIYDNLCPQVHPDGRPAYLPGDARLMVGDVRDRPALREAISGADGVAHLAAAVGVAQSQYEVRHYCDVNVTGTATLCDILAKEKHRVGKVVAIGSMTQYGEGVYRRGSDGALVRPPLRSEAEVRRCWEPCDRRSGEPLEPVPTPETAALNGTNVYSRTKRMQEELILNLDEVYDIPAVSLRFFNVYGPRQSLNNPYTGVLAIFISRILNGKPPLVFEDGGQSRDFVHVTDAARAVVTALTGPIHGTCINVGSGKAVPIGELAARLCARLGPELRPRITERFRKGDVRHCTADIGRAEALLGFSPRVCLDEGIEDLICWSAEQRPEDKSEQAMAELVAHGLSS